MTTTRRGFIAQAGALVGAGAAGCSPHVPLPQSTSAVPAAPAPAGLAQTEVPHMPIQITGPVDGRTHTISSIFTSRSLGLNRALTSPVMVFDDFHINGRPFAPHPHAGFSVLTVVFADSQSPLRNRDSLGNHHVVAPGGVCWFQAGRGAHHEEIPAVPGQTLHGLQVFVNLSTAHKDIAPSSFALAPEAVPHWEGPEGDRVRVLVGRYDAVASPIQPVEPFSVLDVHLQTRLPWTQPANTNTLVYVVSGTVTVESDGGAVSGTAGQGLVLSGQGAATLAGIGSANALILSGADPGEPVVQGGPFIMSSSAALETAYARLRSGQMGRLDPWIDA